MGHSRLSEVESLEDAPSVVDDAAFAAALKARSERAWSTLYDHDYSLIYRYVLARTSDASAAEDLAATVFLEALQSINSYTYRGTPILAWLYRIARNVVSDYRKSLRRRAQRNDSTAPATELKVAAEAIESAGIIDLRDAVRSLKDSQREVIVLHYYVGLTLPEVAALVGKKERAVYSLQARAIEALRRSM